MTLAVILMIAGAGILFFVVTKRNPLAEVGDVLKGKAPKAIGGLAGKRA